MFPIDPDEFSRFLRCPDDGTEVQFERDRLRCLHCSRRFEIRGTNFLEMLPVQPSELSTGSNAAYRQGYLDAFHEPFVENPDARAWGSAETVPAPWLAKRLRQVRRVAPIVTDGATPHQVLCDVAAGAGHYTFAYSGNFHLVFHCDLSVANLNYARKRAHESGIRNIVFIRCDYFSLPFRHTLDRIICVDTLVRGEEHEAKLLLSITRSLAASGRAVVDFHNWWHNPLRRMGILPENFSHNRSYSRRQASALIRRHGIDRFSYFPFVQEFENGAAGKVASVFLPPTRLIYRIEAPAQPALEPVPDQLIASKS